MSERFVTGTNAPPSAHKMIQLDALRAFAVLSVLFAHFVSHPPRFLAIFPWAALGVQLFFVLSGFLITGILLDSRREVEAGAGRFWMLRQFYIRRFLRIIPLYYAMVLVGWMMKLPGFTETLGWNLAYLTNYYIVRNAGWVGAASHLWTLSIEEQFYLVWPWIVLFLPNRWLLPTFVGVGIFAIAYRVMIIGSFGPWMGAAPVTSFDWRNLLLFPNLTSFGAGALLALAQRRDKAGDPLLRRILCAGLWLGIPLAVLAVGSGFSPGSIADRLGLLNLAMPLLFMPLIYRAAEGFTGITGILLTRQPLLYLGKISYGIYMFHLPLWWLIGAFKWLNRLPRFIPHSAVFFVVTVGIAAISWHFFECPINRLKRFFPYRDTRLGPTVGPVPGLQPEVCPPAQG